MVPSKKRCGKSKNTTMSTLKFDVYCQKTANIVKNGNFHICWFSNSSKKNCCFRQYLSKRARIVVSALNSRLLTFLCAFFERVIVLSPQFSTNIYFQTTYWHIFYALDFPFPIFWYCPEHIWARLFKTFDKSGKVD